MEDPISLYMRDLPKEYLIGYDTVEGKRLFKQALLEGGLEAFFPLSQQFLTASSTIAMNRHVDCGVGTLCMILNALKVDPAVTWRKPWRWFTQDMLDCCQPLEHVKKFGITLAEFSCLAKCNGLEATTKFANETTLEEFEEAIKASTFFYEQFLAVSFSRASLGQTGSGHFSPVGGYCSDRGGMVLVLDVARFKYPSYWVPIKILFQSLIPIDPATNQPRGYSILRRSHPNQNASGSLFRLNVTKRTWPSIFGSLCLSVVPASSPKDLVVCLLHALEKNPNPVLARYEDLSSDPSNDTSSSPASNYSIVSAQSPYGTMESVRSKLEYQSQLYAFHEHLEKQCVLYGAISVDFAKLEITVFFLALFGMQSFQNHLNPELKDFIIEKLGWDMQDPWIAREAGTVRRQMESMEGCCQAEGKCG